MAKKKSREITYLYLGKVLNAKNAIRYRYLDLGGSVGPVEHKALVGTDDEHWYGKALVKRIRPGAVIEGEETEKENGEINVGKMEFLHYYDDAEWVQDMVVASSIVEAEKVAIGEAAKKISAGLDLQTILAPINLAYTATASRKRRQAILAMVFEEITRFRRVTR